MHGVDLIEVLVEPGALQRTVPNAGRLMRPNYGLLPLGYDSVVAEVIRDRQIDGYFSGTGGDHLFVASPSPMDAADYLSQRSLQPGLLTASYDIARASDDTVWSVLGGATRELNGRADLRQRLQRPIRS